MDKPAPDSKDSEAEGLSPANKTTVDLDLSKPVDIKSRTEIGMVLEDQILEYYARLLQNFQITDMPSLRVALARIDRIYSHPSLIHVNNASIVYLIMAILGSTPLVKINNGSSIPLSVITGTERFRCSILIPLKANEIKSIGYFSILERFMPKGLRSGIISFSETTPKYTNCPLTKEFQIFQPVASSWYSIGNTALTTIERKLSVKASVDCEIIISGLVFSRAIDDFSSLEDHGFYPEYLNLW